MSAIYRHKKTGGLYDLVGFAQVQTSQPLNDYDDVTVYSSEEGKMWVRPTSEFNDGRFEHVGEWPIHRNIVEEWEKINLDIPEYRPSRWPTFVLGLSIGLVFGILLWIP